MPVIPFFFSFLCFVCVFFAFILFSYLCPKGREEEGVYVEIFDADSFFLAYLFGVLSLYRSIPPCCCYCCNLQLHMGDRDAM